MIFYNTNSVGVFFIIYRKVKLNKLNNRERIEIWSNLKEVIALTSFF